MTSYDNPASGTSYHGRPATGTQTPGLAVAALVTGIGGLIFFWLIPILGLALGVLGVVFGVMTTRRAKAGAPGKGMGTAGIVTGAVSIVGALVFWAVAVAVLAS
ncbi:MULTISPECIES: DUF4190 domain-containing protein [unclassified Streptomyces]|uniref:DUF4190 domain-containing protein n=1 Tax=Streptomyces evansiae TaxID=3075535 RepID=A0ABD5E8P9_9ACTN|nr:MULTISPECIES: DUF4190 domain-containing protein [unclassified Streptomyces]EGJ75025.1 hypothetical protein STTU_2236 [Streptomyces sp. Tu6071]MDT0417635.1 DUF4190 domain-containing protein [Streptomyces sp. DSM 41982]SCD94301.1 hypothetical protein GA0115251_13026 [Streptomyces sp. TverLS-915]SCE32132.1 hypothetical protein GA0115246_114415 [Streptomyces sp. SolWspMP-sol7th]